jgi:hypothetical protein
MLLRKYGLLNSIYALEENYVYETENSFSVYAGYSLFILRMTLRLNFTHDAQNLRKIIQVYAGCVNCNMHYAKNSGFHMWQFIDELLF